MLSAVVVSLKVIIPFFSKGSKSTYPPTPLFKLELTITGVSPIVSNNFPLVKP